MSHYYNDEGKLIEGNITTCRKHNLNVSFTTYKDILAKSWGLSQWIIDEHIKEAFDIIESNLGFIDVEFADGKTIQAPAIGHTKKELIKEVKERQSVKRDTTMDFGSEMHNFMRRIVKGDLIELSHRPEDEQLILKSMVKWAKDNEVEPLEQEKTYVIPELRTASTIDILCMLKGEKWLIDYKTQSTKKDKPVTIYDDMIWQLGAYHNLVRTDGHEVERFGNLIISSTEPGRIEMVEHKREKIDWGEAVAAKTLELFKIIKKL